MEEKRRHARIPISLDVLCSTADGLSVAGTVRDLSLGGAFIYCAKLLAFGTKLTIAVRLPGAREDSQLPAVVQWSQPEGVGVQFGLLGARETHLLVELVRHGGQRSA
ncbi:PilZ domain-containing protein [Myxococcota bacterium]